MSEHHPLKVLVSLFENIDDTFASLWSRSRYDERPGWYEQVQSQLSKAVPPDLRCTEAQEFAIQVTKLWLKVKT
jgi:hypothetical protein